MADKEFVTDADIAHLAMIVSPRDMEKIALRYLNVSLHTIENIRAGRPDPTAFNRSVLLHWRTE